MGKHQVSQGLSIFVISNTDYILLLSRDIQSTSQKIRRIILQFTPESWTPIYWFVPSCTYGRYLAVTVLVISWQLTELNTFFLKHIFEMPPAHPLNTYRIALLGCVVAPSVPIETLMK